MPTKAKNAAKTSAKKAKKSSDKVTIGPSIGPVWKAIEAFEKKVRAMKNQPEVYSKALGQLKEAKKSIPDCEERTGDFENRLLRPKKD